MPVLLAMQGPQPGQLFPLEGELAVLGRHPDCDIVLESGSVSRQHARIFTVDGKYYVEDLQSRNGTFVNGQTVVDRQLLVENDELVICDLVFVFHDAYPEPGLQRPQPRSEATALLVDDDRSDTNATVMSRVDVTSSSSGLHLEINTKAKLKALIEIGQNLGKALGLDEVLPNLLESLFSIFIQADRGFVVLREPRDGHLIPKVVKHRRQKDEEAIRISKTIVNRVMESKEAILSADAAADSRFDMAESIVDFHIRSMMCAPLVDSEGNALGVIQIDTLDQRNRFNGDDLDLLACVACQAARAVETAQLHETVLREQTLARDLAVANQVQRGFLPDRPPQLQTYDFFEFYEPAYQLGGDYYDYVQLPEGRLAVVVADVSGKGIAASLLMAKLATETPFSLATEPTPADAVGRLNRVFCGNNWEDRFVTLVLAVIDPAHNEVTVVNAGHMPPLLRRRSAAVEAVAEPETRLPLGVDDHVIYAQRTVSLESGESLILYTDGITEAMNDTGELYGSRRLWAQITPDRGRVESIGRCILDDVKRFVGARSQSDDMCLVCFGREDGA